MSVLIIANPVSGGYSKYKIDRITKILKSKFPDVSLYLTKSKGDATVVAKSTDAAIIVAAGGDGLLNEVATGLVGREGKLLAVLPFGTANVFCHEYAISLNPIKAAKKLSFDKVLNIPVGMIDDKLFLLMVGFGFDADVVRKVEYKSHLLSKKISYILSGFSSLIKPSKDLINVSVSGHEYALAHLVVAIVSSYGGRYKLGKIEAGKLNLFAIFPQKRINLLKSIMSILFGKGFSGSRMQVEYMKVNDVAECQIDGEYYTINKDSVYISIQKNALRLVY